MGVQYSVDIQQYGAVADAKTVNTGAIQKAIDACHAAGGGRVLCGPGTFITGSLVLRSHVELHLMAGCRLVGSSSVDDYDDLVAAGFRSERAPERTSKSLVRAVNAEHVAITGLGEINGSGLAFFNTEDMGGRFFRKPSIARPRTVMFYQCRDVRLAGISLIDSPCWTVWLMKCERVSIHGMRVLGDQRMINNDGINLDACRDVVVSDCIIRTADDCIALRAISGVYDTPAVCENVTISNCTLDSWCSGIRVGCPGDGVIRACTFSNIVIKSASNGIVIDNLKRYLPADSEGSADIHDLVFSQVIIDCDAIPLRVSAEEGVRLPRLGDLSFSDFRIRSGGPCLVEGNPQTIIRNVSFDHMHICTSGKDAFVCRYCEGVRFSEVCMSNRSSMQTAVT